MSPRRKTDSTGWNWYRCPRNQKSRQKKTGPKAGFLLQPPKRFQVSRKRDYLAAGAAAGAAAAGAAAGAAGAAGAAAAGAGAAAGAAGAAAGASFLPQAVTAIASRAATRSDCFIFFPLIKVVEERLSELTSDRDDYRSSLSKLYTVCLLATAVKHAVNPCIF
jgi:hypothetical protein